MEFKDTVKAGYNKIANRYRTTRTRDSEDVRLLDDLIQRLPAGANVLDGGQALLCLGAENLIDDLDENYPGTRMYWSHYNTETYLKMLRNCGFSIIWSKRVEDNSCEGAGQLFVLAQKYEP